MRLVRVVVVVALVSGCSVTGTPKPGPPAAKRTLVEWANVVCSQAKTLDEFRETGSGGSNDHTFRVNRITDDTLKRLKAIDKAGIKAADDYVAGLIKQLEELKPQLPKADERPDTDIPPEEDLALGKEAAAAFAKLEPQRPKLGKMAEAREFVSSYNAAPACDPVSESAERPLVQWANAMCDAVRTVATLRTDPNFVVEDPGYRKSELSSHINTASSMLRLITEPLAPLHPTGVREADELRDGLQEAAKDAKAKLPPPVAASASLGIPELTGRSTQTAAALAPLKPKIEGFPAVVQKGEDLQKAYQLAPNCEIPNAPKPPLAPRNGTDYAACATGTCEVRINEPVFITVQELRVRVAVRLNQVHIDDDDGRITLNNGGTGFYRINGKAVEFHLMEVKPFTAVVDISIK